MLTEDQLQALLSMGDIGGQESEMKNQLMLANQLRGMVGGIKGKDVGSNIGRGGFGISSALREYNGMGMKEGIGADKKALLGKLFQPKPKMPFPHPPSSADVIAPLSDEDEVDY